MSKVPVITIDGPGGTAKGTVCRKVAEQLDWHMLDSGAIYRVLALAVINNHTAPEDILAVVELAKNLDLKFKSDEDNTFSYLNNQDVSQAIRREEVGQMASKIASIPEVRAALLARQRDFAMKPGLVTDGRDMGTVVFPDAFLKIYLDASTEERAKRRYLQLQASGISVSLAEVLQDLTNRDERDAKRAIAPLKPAEDAVIVDTTGLTIVQVVNYILQLVDSRLKY